MIPPVARWLRIFIGMICLVMVSLGTSSNEKACDSHFGYRVTGFELKNFTKTCAYNDGLSVGQLRFEFGNWIPEAIRTVTIRLVSLASSRSDFFLSKLYTSTLFDFPIYQLLDFKRAPDFVGFLFRLKPF